MAVGMYPDPHVNAVDYLEDVNAVIIPGIAR